MTGRIIYSPQARQQLRNIDDWIVGSASPEVANQYLARVIDHIEAILVFPDAGQLHEDLRPGLRTTTYKGRTLIAYAVDDSSGEVIVTILGVFHGGQHWEATLAGSSEPNER